uniref:CUB domain-containing protein n=1 Tax=Steinernema glaseri TaxID=37863 RepID=A0A1I7Z7E0_9BILA
MASTCVRFVRIIMDDLWTTSGTCDIRTFMLVDGAKHRLFFSHRFFVLYKMSSATQIVTEKPKFAHFVFLPPGQVFRGGNPGVYAVRYYSNPGNIRSIVECHFNFPSITAILWSRRGAWQSRGKLQNARCIFVISQCTWYQIV